MKNVFKWVILPIKKVKISKIADGTRIDVVPELWKLIALYLKLFFCPKNGLHEKRLQMGYFAYRKCQNIEKSLTALELMLPPRSLKINSVIYQKTFFCPKNGLHEKRLEMVHFTYRKC